MGCISVLLRTQFLKQGIVLNSSKNCVTTFMTSKSWSLIGLRYLLFAASGRSSSTNMEIKRFLCTRLRAVCFRRSFFPSEFIVSLSLGVVVVVAVVCVCTRTCACKPMFGYVWLFATPWTVAHLPGFSVHGIFQAQILEWVAISSSKWSSGPRDQIHVSWVSFIGRQILYPWATWEA